MNNHKIELDMSVIVGLDIMSESDKENILKAINSLETFGEDQPLPDKIKKITIDKKYFYMLKATPKWRLIFEIKEPGKIEINDLFPKERLELFAKCNLKK